MFKTLLRGALALALLSSPVLGQQVWKWSQTPATNASADPAINWATGMAPSAVSPSARAMMAAVAKYRDDTAGRLTTAGTSTAYTVTTNSGYASTPADGTKIAIVPHATNGASATLAADSGSTFPIRVDASNAVPAAALVLGSPYTVVFNSSASAWILHGYYGSPSAVPIGAVLDYAGTTAPNSNFALSYGQAISRTTYAGLFAQVGTTFGVGDGTTTFNLPDTRGRAIFGVDNMGGSAANRITVAGGNFDGTVLGGTGGSQNHTTTIAEMPVHTPAGTITPLTATGTTGAENSNHFHLGSTDSAGTHSHTVGPGTPSTNGQFSGLISPNNGWGGAPGTSTTSSDGAHTHTFTTGLQNAGHTHTFTTNSFTPVFNGTAIGSGTAHTILPPAIILSKIIRIF
jgi:microcystin-dependent protein